MAEDEDRWQQLIRGLREGDQLAAQAFWDQYGGLLEQVAKKHLPGGLRRRVGPEDVVQSACRTFLRRAQGGEFQLEDSAGLWRLLCAITLTKIREQARFHLRKKRGLDQEANMQKVTDGSVSEFPFADSNPTPAEAAEFADQFQQLLSTLDDEERAIVDLKLQEFTHEEVATQLGCSERTVRRVVKRVQERLAKLFDIN
ncbi:MAG TPA: sigma-70 family RNA polymerase sigma factor [Gemmataceae bacterium]|nr:sigma-70 family RNA polymerase sigma factor [Gemmataceae bacterium]